MRHPQRQREGEEGYLLLGLVVACFILLLVLGVAAPRVAKQLERDREVESEHRAQEYVRAIQLYYAKTHSYPNSIEQLVGSSSGGSTMSALSVRYLRQQYKDPLTNDEYRLIHVGENKTQVKGFFGEPLEGMPQGGQIPGTSTPGSSVPSVFGNNSNTSTGSAFNNSGSGSAFNNSGSSSSGSAFNNSGTSATGTSGTGTGTSSTTGNSTGTGTSGSSTDATTFQGSKGPIMGVGSNAKGHGLVEWNGSENIEDWEFLYDPRVELLKAKVSLLGGSPAASGSGSIGSGLQAPGAGTGIGGNSSIFGSGSSSASGTSGTSGTSTTGTSSGSTGNTPTSGTTPTQ